MNKHIYVGLHHVLTIIDTGLWFLATAVAGSTDCMTLLMPEPK